MNVEVIVAKWGTYKLGDTIFDMPETTAQACIKHGVVRDLDAEETEEEDVNEEEDLSLESEVADDVESEEIDSVETDEVVESESENSEGAAEVADEKEEKVKPTTKNKTKNA